jgi:hypothetical protein
MQKKLFFIIIILIVSNNIFLAQSRDLIALVNAGECETCQVGPNCQPDPLAGSPSHNELGYTIEQIWGTKQEVVIASRTFFFFNVNTDQKQMLIEALEILPTEYINMLPKNFRVGNPNRPYAIASSGRQIGGSKFCQPYDENNLQYESIVLHEAIFTINNKKHRTILHECGHFFSRKFDVVDRMSSEQIAQSTEYLTNVYHGATSSHDETVAQCFMFFFHQMYFNSNARLASPKTFEQIVPQPARKFQSWMCNFIKPIIQETSSF